MVNIIIGLIIGAFAGYQYFWQRQKRRAVAQLMEEIENGIEWAYLCKDYKEVDMKTRENARCFVCKAVKRHTPPKCFVDAEGVIDDG